MTRQVVAAVLAMTWAAWAEGPRVVPSVRLVKASPVQAGAKETSTGSLFPSKMLPLGFEVGGRLATSRVTRGETVKAGQPLGALDTEIVDSQVAQAEAGLMAAEAGSALATDVAGRQEKLKAEGSVSEVASKSADTQSRQAQAQVAAAKATLSQVRAARRRHELRAPFGGTLIEAPDQVGGMVGPGMPVYILQQLDPLVLKTTVSEALRTALKPGLKVRVEAVGAPTATDEAQVRLVLPSADPQTRRVPVEVLVPNADGRFVANTMARVTFPLGEAKQAYLVPASALGNAGGEHVFVVDAQGALKRVNVAVVERGAREVSVVAAEALEEVVDAPSSALVPGTKVKR